MTFCFQGREEKIPNAKCWYPQVVVYDPIKAGSIDSTDVQPHDNGILRAMHSNYKPSYKALGNPLHTIFVGRLSMDTKEEDLENEFSHYGKMIALRLVKDIVTGLSKRYAFIEYETYKMALNAYLHCKSVVIKNSEIFVDFECGRLLPGWKPRRLGGGFGGEKQSGQLRFGGRMRNFRQPLNFVESRNSKNTKEENKEVLSRTSYSSTRRRPYSSSNDISTMRSSSTRKPYSSSKHISTSCSSSTKSSYSSSNDFSTKHVSSTKRPYSNSKNVSSTHSSFTRTQSSNSKNTSSNRSSSTKRPYSSSNNFSSVHSSSTSRSHSSSNNFSSTHSSSTTRQSSSSQNNSKTHSSSTSRPHSNYVSPTSGPSTISLPLTPPSNPTIVLPLTPPSHSSIVLPLTPPSQSIIVLPLTPPSNSSVTLPLTPPSQSSVPLPLTPPLNLDAPPHNSM